MIIRWRKILRRWVPGIISGGADNDPSGIATYSISGAQFGYQQLWLLVLSTPMLIAIQAMCARLGDVKGKGLMAIMRDHFAPIFAVSASVVLVITNIATLGADLAGMADALGLATHSNFIWWVIPVSVIMWYVILFQNHKVIEKYLFFLSFAFLGYIVSGFLSKPDWFRVVREIFLSSVTPSVPFFLAGLGLMGTTITPFLFFWQARQGVEEHKSKQELLHEAKQEDKEIAPGFLYSNLISLFIIISTASVFHARGSYTIVTAADAARALEPLAGRFATYLFSFGIICSGLLAVPVLAASTAYVVAETFGWRESLSDRVNKAKGFYTVMTSSILVGVGIAMSGVSPMQALLYSQVLSGILAPIFIILILFMCNDKKIMGPYVNRWFDNVFGWIAVIIMLLGSAGLFWQLVSW